MIARLAVWIGGVALPRDRAEAAVEANALIRRQDTAWQ